METKYKIGDKVYSNCNFALQEVVIDKIIIKKDEIIYGSCDWYCEEDCLFETLEQAKTDIEKRTKEKLEEINNNKNYELKNGEYHRLKDIAEIIGEKLVLKLEDNDGN